MVGVYMSLGIGANLFQGPVSSIAAVTGLECRNAASMTDRDK
jgi:hypothetical protein